MKANEFMKKGGFWIGVICVLVLVGLSWYNNSREGITNFDECVAAGNPVMESYPRQCRDDESDRTFTEVIEDGLNLEGVVDRIEIPRKSKKW